jgi:predicted nucleotide-binding protein
VILELGYFIGRLGRGRVCALKVNSVEEPSDLHGVLYIPVDAAGAWILRLAKELKAAGVEIDMNRAV